MNRSSVLLYKKLSGCLNHHQLQNEHVLHNFAFLSNNFQEQLVVTNTANWKEEKCISF